MRFFFGSCVFLVLTAVGGCATDTSKAFRVDAFDPEGHSDSPPTTEALEQMMQKGMLISFEKGDELVLNLSGIRSELVEKTDDHTLRVRRPFYILASKNGIRISLDDEDFDDHAVHGSVSLGLLISEKSKKNLIEVSLQQKD